MKDSQVYVLSLGKSKYYVGRIDKGYNIDDRMAKYAAGGGSLWVQKYGFLSLDEVIEGDEFCEMNTTLKFMHKYGIDNVRGSSWNNSNSYLKTGYMYPQIERIIQSIYNTCHLCGEEGHYSTHCNNR
jgi:hypothetical protein